MYKFMSRVKQFIHDNSEFSQSDIQSFIHSLHSDLPSNEIQNSLNSTNSTKKQKIQDFKMTPNNNDVLYKLLFLLLLKSKQ